MTDRRLLSVMARSILGGDLTTEGVASRLAATFDQPFRWLGPLAKRFVAAASDRTRPRHREVVEFLANDAVFQRILARQRSLSIRTWLTAPSQMQPVAAAALWNIPAIESAGELASWLGIQPGEMDWFADLKDLSRSPRLHHYNYRVLPKSNGAVRLIEGPKSRLKTLQRQILAAILSKVPPHPAVHGFVKDRSIRTFVAPHASRHVVLRMDLAEFFPSFIGARIQTWFRTMGYPEAVADALGGICTNATPRRVWHGTQIDRETQDLYKRPHLPQGAPTSPALANQCAYRVDCRLTGLAKSAGAAYTRYADDLAFSGDADFERRVEPFSTHVAAILMEEGFRVQHRKTRIMRQGVRQHLAGIVTNDHPNVMRRDFDELKAILTNCVRHGPDTQNWDGHADFRAHLLGRLSFVEMINPQRALKLRAIFDRIHWNPTY